MPTLICFSGLGGDAIAVEETPEQILDVLSSGDPTPRLFTRNGPHDLVYINPERIACWYVSVGGDIPMIPRPFRGPI